MLVTLSDDGYTKKPSRDRYYRISYSNFNLSLQEIYNDLLEGHVLSCTFKDEYYYDFTFKKGFSKRENFKQIYYVMVDLDEDIEPDLEELIESIPYKPNISYTTFSHKLDNFSNRYRLLYFFEEPIVNPYLYRELYMKLTKGIKCKKDNSAASPYQLCHGTSRVNKGFSSFLNEKLYRIEDFMCKEPNVHKSDKSNLSFIELYENSSEFMRDVIDLSYDEVFDKYHDEFEYIDHSPYIDVGDERYMIVPDDFVDIYIKWEWYVDDNGKKRSKPHIWRDGEHRRKRLFHIACDIIAIKPDVTIDELVYNLMLRRKYFFNNSDGVLSVQELMSIAVNARKRNVKVQPTKHPARKIKMEYCRENGLKPQTVLGEILKEEKYAMIEKLYDPEKTNKENVEAMQICGVKVSERTLQRWKREVLDANDTVNNIFLELNNNIQYGGGVKSDKRNQYGKVISDEDILGMIDFSKSAYKNCLELREDGICTSTKRIKKLMDRYKD